MYYIYTPSRQLGLTRSHFCKRYAVNRCDTVAFCGVLYDGKCDGWSYCIRSKSLWICVGCTRQYHVSGTVWSLRHPTRVHEDLQRKYYIGRIKTIMYRYGVFQSVLRCTRSSQTDTLFPSASFCLISSICCCCCCCNES
jgi:hypothetical protein